MPAMPSSEVSPLSTIHVLTFPLLLDLLVQHQAIDPKQRLDLLGKEQSLRTRFLRERFGAQGHKRIYEVSPTELLAAARLPHPKAPGQTIDEDVLAELLAQIAGRPFFRIDPLELNVGFITKILPKGFARRHLMLPLDESHKRIRVAVADPFDLRPVEEFARAKGYQVDVVVTSKRDIVNVINNIYGFRQAVTGIAEEKSGAATLQNLEQLVRVRNAEDIDPSDRKIVAAVEYLLNSAFDNRASDVHIEPKRAVSKLRLRIDGVLHEVGELPLSAHLPVVSRIKILARMDIAERRRPQDGRIKTQRGDREIELRVSSLPVAFGEKIVIRIFDPQVLLADVTDLGLTGKDRELYDGWISRPNGLVLVTGPTGSGKTTTLYSTLKELARPGVNIVTVEDPIEMVYEPLNQVAVQPKIDVSFAKALRTILRQDPDIIMVGEIRDAETAMMTVQSALTGHLVFSTLHTNDASTAVSRLLDLGSEPFLLASVLTGVLAQRLLRKVCRDCAVDVLLKDEEIISLGIPLEPGESRKLPVKEGEGCVRCRNTGLYGRTGVFEMLDASPKIKRMIIDRADSKELAKAATLDGMVPLRQGAIRKLAQGITTYAEVFRVTADTEL